MCLYNRLLAIFDRNKFDKIIIIKIKFKSIFLFLYKYNIQLLKFMTHISSFFKYKILKYWYL